MGVRYERMSCTCGHSHLICSPERVRRTGRTFRVSAGGGVPLAVVSRRGREGGWTWTPDQTTHMRRRWRRTSVDATRQKRESCSSRPPETGPRHLISADEYFCGTCLPVHNCCSQIQDHLRNGRRGGKPLLSPLPWALPPGAIMEHEPTRVCPSGLSLSRDDC